MENENSFFSDEFIRQQEDYDRRNTPAANASAPSGNAAQDEKPAALVELGEILEPEEEKVPAKKTRKKSAKKDTENRKNTRMLHIVFPEQDFWRVKMLAVSKHMSMSDMVYEWYLKEVKKHDGI